jgi:Zn-dependent peptidase ImmA (M78 family)
MEWQADTFAGYLLMPKEMVFEKWREVQGDLDPYVAIDEIADLSARWGLAEDETPTVSAARDLAQHFRVSGQAMQIRLVGLSLILTEPPEPGLFKQ